METPQNHECDMGAAVTAVEALLRYNFTDRYLLEEALTHNSYSDSPSYQRLEFLGDATLGCALTNYIYLAYKDLEPGQLSLIKSANISTERLARVAVKHGLYQYVRRNAPTLDEKVREFSNAVHEENELPIYGGLMKAPKILADVVEALAAAVYIDCKFDLQRLWVVFRAVLEPIVTLEDLQRQPQPVTMLFELCQKHGKKVNIKYLKNGSIDIATVFIDGHCVATGASEQREFAKLNAAKEALEKLSQTTTWVSDVIIDGCNGNGVCELEAAKQKLHDICCKKKWRKPSYKVEHEWGPPHDRKFMCSVSTKVVDAVLCMEGDTMSRIKDAENSAALSMLLCLYKNGYV